MSKKMLTILMISIILITGGVSIYALTLDMIIGRAGIFFSVTLLGYVIYYFIKEKNNK